jgi:hypothetical protein
MNTTNLNEKALQSPVDAPALPDAAKEGEEGEEDEEGSFPTDNDTSKKGKTRPICGDCGRSCANSRMLRYHKTTHLNYNERPYGCETCGRRYAYPSHLARHRRQKHVNIREHSQKHMRTHKQLQKHMDIHTQPREEEIQKLPADEEIQSLST